MTALPTSSDRRADAPGRRRFLALAAAGAAGLGLLRSPLSVGAAGAADVLLLNCIDYRLTGYTTSYMEQQGLAQRYDQVVIAGAALAATYPGVPAWNQTFFDQLKLAIDLHGITGVTVIDHRDCGAYREFLGQDYAQDPAAETAVHSAYMNTLRQQINSLYPDLDVQLLLMALDGSVQDLT